MGHKQDPIGFARVWGIVRIYSTEDALFSRKGRHFNSIMGRAKARVRVTLSMFT